MVGSDRPLLARDGANSDVSDEQEAEEEDALLTGQTNRRDPRPVWREYILFGWALIATIALVVLSVLYQHSQIARDKPHETEGKLDGKRNLIFMVSDGMGPASLSLTRSFRQYEQDLPIDDVLMLDHHLIGNSRTRSASSLITDSAAGATAFSCGKKSYNEAISVLPDGTPCGTVLEAAKRAGYMTGLVVTTRITDATPACFASHVKVRSEEDSIARQLIGDHPLGHQVDLLLGGGRCHFQPRDQGGCRADDLDVVSLAKEKGYHYINTRNQFNALENGNKVELPLLGLFAFGDIPFELDRRNQNDTYPSLDEMARTAMRALSAATKDNDKGFFLLVEGSRIDHGGHNNDPAAQVHEVLAYDKAFTSVLDFLENDSTNGVAVSTSDHETGGLSIARQVNKNYPEYLWYPSVLSNVSRSAENLARYFKYGVFKPNLTAKIVQQEIESGLGIIDYTTDEINSVLATYRDTDGSKYVLADMISKRAQIGWSTHGHSAVDVNIYASSAKHARKLAGNHENTDVGKFLHEYLDVDVEDITKDLNKKMAEKEWAWMHTSRGQGERKASTAHPEEDSRHDLGGAENSIGWEL